MARPKVGTQAVVEAPAPTVAKSSDELAEEYKARAAADVRPGETARQRLERLEAESKIALKQARKDARAEAKADTTSGVPAAFIPDVTRIIGELESASKLTARWVSIRYNRKGDAAGTFVVKSRFVKARSK